MGHQGEGNVLQPLPSFPPINFIYSHFHNSIRRELEELAKSVADLDRQLPDHAVPRLSKLRDDYRFLEQVYKYHSSVEDEVVYPALDAKVKNVTVAYSVEHQDEEHLFEQLAHLASAALSQKGDKQAATVRELICKAEEIHRTIKSHLAKEEGQLLPLLLQHFSFAEQAGLVAQFLYSIPLATVERVLAWLKPMVPQVEQEQLLSHIQSVVPDQLLLQLLTSWLQATPSAEEAAGVAEHDAQAAAARGATGAGVGDAGAGGNAHAPNAAAAAPQPNKLDSCSQNAIQKTAGEAGVVQATIAVGEQQGSPTGAGKEVVKQSQAPIKGITHIHRTICTALEEFSREANALQLRADVTAGQLASLMEQHRFLRRICMFHTISEEEVMYPEVRRLASADPALRASMNGIVGCDSGATSDGMEGADAACFECEREHEEETSALEDLGRLLSDVRAFARRGRQEVTRMLEQLSNTAEQVRDNIARHMAREESQVFPLLERHLCATQQRAMVWRTLRAMPLRLLERLMPWVAASLSADDSQELMENIRLGAPAPDATLVQLLLRWADEGRRGAPPQRLTPAPPLLRAGSSNAAHTVSLTLAPADSAVDHSGVTGGVGEGNAAAMPAAGAGKRLSLPGQASGEFGAGDSDADAHVHKRPRLLGALSGAASSSLFSQASTGLHMNGRDSVSPKGAAQHMHLNGDGAEGQAATAAPQQSSALTQETIVLLPPSGLPSAGTTALAPNGVGGSQHCHHLLGQQGTQQQDGSGLQGPGTTTSNNIKPKPAPNKFNPIDHIFQFHHALRQELRQLEADALQVEVALQQGSQPQQQDGGTPGEGGQIPRRVATAIQALEGRFQFLWGIYRAHSRSEDEIVFPALESKHALRNVSHAYTLDHQQEEQLFHDLQQVIDALRHCESNDMRTAREHALAVRRTCAAVRASLETHIRAEEAELWPLFTEHFTTEEQQYLVGVIIGRTGAQVLQALLPFISESLSLEEKELMMGSLREVTKNTMFDKWLGAVTHGAIPGPQGSGSPDGGANTGSAPTGTANGTTNGCTGSGSGQVQQGGQAGGARMGKAGSGGGNSGVGVLDPEAAEYLRHAATAAAAKSSGAAGGGGLQGAERGEQESAAVQSTPDVGGGSSGNLQGTQQQQQGHAGSSAGATTAAPGQQPGQYAAGAAGAVNGGDTVTGVVDSDMGKDQQQPSSPPAHLHNHNHSHHHNHSQQQTTTVLESSSFSPGWEDIFRINQSQLEAAIMRVSADSRLEPGRKAYLIQNILVSRYIVAQQRRMQQEQQRVEQMGGEQHCHHHMVPNGGQAQASAAGQDTSSGGIQSVDAAAAGGAATIVPHSSTSVPPQQHQGGAGNTLGGCDSSAAVRTYHCTNSGVLGCKHYRRKARLVAPCCDAIYTCRLCHDEVESHRMDRYEVSEMVCMECGTRQAVAGNCTACSAQMARYYCGICHLLDDEPGRSIYHCPFCNVCRLGQGLGIDAIHCMRCNACMSLSIFKTHTCRQGAMEVNCPVCHEYVFDSADPVKELPCGHMLHSGCFANYTRSNYKCPVCLKSMGDMGVFFRMLDSLLASERLPPEYAGRMQQVLCNDCGKTGFARFHFAYHACPHCRSYNTRLV